MEHQPLTPNIYPMRYDLRHGDCLELMKDIPDGSVDAIICDLPYGVTAMQWDSIIPIDKLWKQYERIIKPNGAIVLFCQQPFASMLITSNIEKFRWCYTWVKNLKTNFLQAKKMPMRSYENIAVFGIGRPNYYPQMKKTKWSTTGNELSTEQYKTTRRKQEKRDGECLPDDVIYFDCIHGSQERFHKNQKPDELMLFLVKTFTNEDDLVLDNTMGSGSTGVACKRLNRRFIGIEQEAKYFDIATKRIQDTVEGAGFTVMAAIADKGSVGKKNINTNNSLFGDLL